MFFLILMHLTTTITTMTHNNNKAGKNQNYLAQIQLNISALLGNSKIDIKVYINVSIKKRNGS